MANYSWKPIEALSESDKRIDLAAIRTVYETWRASQERLQESSKTQLSDFSARLIRRLSIETGILERLYDLDRPTTEALVAHGFIEDFVSRSNTDIEPSRLIDILRDQEAAIHLVMQCISNKRPLTKSVLHELHVILTHHQSRTTAVDQFGNRQEIPLLKGKFKELPNNPKRPDGSVHEYCPPIHVDSEIDKLFEWLSTYDVLDPIIVAAWMHHRFTQIHPYQDGNGRVARAITTLVLLRAELLPLVIDRDLRLEYIKSLESADAGDLSVLAALFARLERGAILQALSIDADAEIARQETLTSAVIESLAAKFGKRRETKVAELRIVNTVALALRKQAQKILARALDALQQTLRLVDEPSIYVTEGGPEKNNAHWYRFEVATSAAKTEKFANLTEAHYFVKASIRLRRERLIFVTSFHHVGRDLSGIMEATAFSQLESFDDSEDRESVSQEFFVCSLEPFVFTYKTNSQEIEEAFVRWLDASLAVALKEYGDRL